MKREKAYSWMPYNYVQAAKQWEKKAMTTIIANENEFQVQDFQPDWDYEFEPETRELDRNSLGYSVKVTAVTPEGTVHYYEQFARCKQCAEIVLLAGGCTFCTNCGALLEDNN